MASWAGEADRGEASGHSTVKSNLQQQMKVRKKQKEQEDILKELTNSAGGPKGKRYIALPRHHLTRRGEHFSSAAHIAIFIYLFYHFIQYVFVLDFLNLILKNCIM